MARRRRSKIKKNSWWFKAGIALAGTALLGVGALCYSLNSAIGRNDNKVYILIKEGMTLKDVREQVQTKVWPRYPRILDCVIRYKHLEDHIRPGRYEIAPGVSALELVDILDSGPQTPVELPLSGVRTKADLLNRLDEYLMIDRDQIESALSDSVIYRLEGLNEESMRSLFFSKKYRLLWNTTAKALMDSIRAEHNRYWTPERRTKADKLGLTTAEISTLASIVESESAKTKEYGQIAQLYINRYNKGMLLQSDPTVKFALGDFSIRRILLEHLKADSPYNTYRNKGLPPGPICLPKQATIDSILNAPHHEYIYMCAKEDFSGYHNFAADYATHQSNARKYQEALNKRGILK